ncbi:MAG: hypothetical protein H6Q04_1160 [Acidobacteria bacterium]|nr:hypothetical protein [Acidobacteriota bacterium]
MSFAVDESSEVAHQNASHHVNSTRVFEKP